MTQAPAPRGPARAMPPGACDCHFHIYDPRFPYAAGAGLTPPPAPLERYLQLRRALGLARGVVVQPSSYGTDNRCTMAAVQALGPDAARAVVVLDAAATQAELQSLHAGGARGLRINMLRGARLDRDALDGLCARVRPLGWHLLLHAPASALEDLAPWLHALRMPVVLDHWARIDPADVPGRGGHRAACALLDAGRTWIKLSAPYLASRHPGPDHEDLAPLAADLLRRAPERLLWGSDWPHPGCPPHGQPDDLALFARLCHCLDEAGLLATVLADNPARLYGFGP